MPSDLIHFCGHVETVSFPTAPKKASSTTVVVCVSLVLSSQQRAASDYLTMSNTMRQKQWQ